VISKWQHPSQVDTVLGTATKHPLEESLNDQVHRNTNIQSIQLCNTLSQTVSNSPLVQFV
jgi:hypothetical protein